jgi:LysM repeat protein
VPVGFAEGFAESFNAIPEAERAGVQRVTVSKIQSVPELAARYRITAGQFARYNPNFRKTPRGNVAAGQTVLIPTAATLRGAREVPDPAIERYGSTTRVAGRRTHVVKKGETLSQIARQNATTVDHLMKLNQLRKPTIFPGQELVVSGPASPAAAPRGKAAAKPAAKAPARSRAKRS